MALPTFTKVDKNNWRYRWKYKDKYTGKWRELKRQGFRTKPEAEHDYEVEKAKIEQGFDMAKSERLVDYLEFWLAEYKYGKVAKNTYKTHERNIENHIKPYFQNMKLDDLTPNLYQKFINYLLKEAYNRQTKENGYSKRTVEIIHGTMYPALERARKQKKILENPCEDVVILTAKEQREKKYKKSNVKFLPYEQIGNFLDAALRDNYTYYIFFRFLIETGVRKGEAASLQWENLDLTNGRMRIIQTLDFQPDEKDELFGDTKSYHSEREIPIPKLLVMELKAHQVRQNDNKRRFKEAYRKDLDLVFCRDDGTPLPKSTLFNAFRRILSKIGLPTMKIHTLRHTHAVLMIESQAEMKYIQEALGHGSMQVTSDIYSHVSKKIETDSIKKYEKHTEAIFKDRANTGQ